MAEIKLDTDSGSREFAVGTPVVLKTDRGSASASDWAWKHDGQLVPNAKMDQYEFVVGEDTKGTYIATAKLIPTGESTPVQVASNPLEIKMVPGRPQVVADGAAKVEPPTWDGATAAYAAFGLFVVGVLLAAFLHLWDGRSGFSEADWAGLDGRLKLAAEVLVPMIALGGVVVLIGVWMAIVEWRGRFRKSTTSALATRGPEESLPKIIDAVGKLQGAALVLVVGVLILFAAAWIAQSGVGSTGASAAPSVSQSATPSAR